MIKYKLNLLNFIIGITMISMSLLSAQDCVDDPTGVYSGFGGCDVVINTFMMGCDASFGGYIVGDICPDSCGSSGSDDPTGAYTGFGGCDTVINTWGQSCDIVLSGTLISEECPASCGITCCDSEGVFGNS